MGILSNSLKQYGNWSGTPGDFLANQNNTIPANEGVGGSVRVGNNASEVTMLTYLANDFIRNSGQYMTKASGRQNDWEWNNGVWSIGLNGTSNVTGTIYGFCRSGMMTIELGSVVLHGGGATFDLGNSGYAPALGWPGVHYHGPGNTNVSYRI